MTSELYYIYKMNSKKRQEVRVFTATEAKKLKGQVELCGATFHLKAGVYGLLYCKMEDRSHWTEYAKRNAAKTIEWQKDELRAPNGKIIAKRDLPSQP